MDGTEEGCFQDRTDAGRRLSRRLMAYVGDPEVRVLGLPRGGVPVAFEVAKALGAPLDVFLVRKIGLPGHEELAMGAVASGGVRVVNAEVIQMAGVAPEVIETLSKAAFKELARREAMYRGAGRPPPDLRGRTAILVDDGLATGSSMRAAVLALREKGPRKIVVAVPVAAKDSLFAIERIAEEVISVLSPERFHAVGNWYRKFDQTSDEEVKACLSAAAQKSPIS